MLLLLSYYCYCSLTTAITLYYTPFLSFACFAVQLLLPNYYYSAFLYLLLCYVSISLFSGSTELLFSGYSSMLWAALRGRFETAEGLSIGQGRCLLCLPSPSLLLSGACYACSLHLWCLLCQLHPLCFSWLLLIPQRFSRPWSLLKQSHCCSPCHLWWNQLHLCQVMVASPHWWLWFSCWVWAPSAPHWALCCLRSHLAQPWMRLVLPPPRQPKCVHTLGTIHYSSLHASC